MNFKEKLQNFRKAGYPFVYIQTPEENRVVKDIQEAFKANTNIKVFEWDELRGIFARAKENITPIKETEKITDAIQAIVNDKTENVVYILKDAHMYLPASKVIRGLKNVEALLKARGSMILVVSAKCDMPVELEREFQMLEYDLPGREEIQKRLEFIQSSAIKSTKEGTESLAAIKKKFEISEDLMEQAIDAAKGMTYAEIENAFSLALVENKVFDAGFVKSVFDVKIAQVKKNGMLTYMEPSAGFEDIGGLENLKDWIKRRANTFSAAARKYGLPYSKGTLLNGIPGCGKSALARATAKEFNMPLFQLDIGALFDSKVGGTEANLRTALRIIESIGKCIVFIDEVEKCLNNHAVSGVSDSGTSSRFFGTFLSWMSDHKCPAFVIATSNDFTKLPAELIRKGRFDELWWLDLPDASERKDIWNVIITRNNRDPKQFDLKKLANASTDFTGAEIECAFKEGMQIAFANNGREVTEEDVISAIVDTTPQAVTSKANLDRLRKEADGRLRPAKETNDIEKDMRKISLA